MRALSAWLLATAVLTAAGVARASDIAKDKGTSLGGVHVGPSTGASSTSDSSIAAEGATPEDVGRTTDKLNSAFLGHKRWEVGVSAEYHRLLINNDLEGAAVNKNVVYWAIYGKYDLTKADTLRLSFGMYERFLADAGEPGIRTSDLSLSYSHGFNLPWGVSLRIAAGTLFPTSFSAELSGLITAPSLGVSVDKSFGNFDINLRAQSRYYWDEYTTAAGGNPNLQFETYAMLTLEYKMPFLPALTAGLDIYTEYDWFYNLQSGADSNPSAQMYGVEKDATYSTQPVQQLYGGEVYLRYDLSVWKIKGDVTLAYANGDPTLGYNSLIHDGGVYFYPLFWRLNSEVYGAVSARF